MQAKDIFKSENSAHWYCMKTMQPKHTIIGANGKERATTLRDARKEGTWAPSVTSLLKVAAAPQLEKWQATQYLIAAWDIAPNEGETREEWAKRVIEKGQEESKIAMQFGSELHAHCEEIVQDKPIPETADAAMAECVDAVVRWNQSQMRELIFSERVLVHPDGYAGTCDLLYIATDGAMVLADFKTKKTEADKAIVTYEGYKMQLAAYRKATLYMNIAPQIDRMENIYVSTTEPGRLEVVEFDKAQWEPHEKMFGHLTDYWQLKNGYVPKAD